MKKNRIIEINEFLNKEEQDNCRTKSGTIKRLRIILNQNQVKK
jgi:hypothetical protein